MNRLLLLQQLQNELNAIKETATTILERSNRSIALCRNLYRKFKKEIIQNVHDYSVICSIRTWKD